MKGRLTPLLTLTGQLTQHGVLSGTLTAGHTLSADLTAQAQISGRLTAQQTMYGRLTVPPITGGVPYTGPYEFTPSREEQTVVIRDRVATANITIKPIPQNYGLITWNGSALTVS